MEKTCKIILVDDHSLFRNGLRGLLAAHPGYEVVGEAASGEEFLTMLPALAADVAFMDIAMPGMAGDEATVQALGLQPDLKIITLSMYGEEVYYTRMMTAGAKGFLLKDSDFSEVIEAIDTVSAGGSYICHELLVQLTGRLHTPHSILHRPPSKPSYPGGTCPRQGWGGATAQPRVRRQAGRIQRREN